MANFYVSSAAYAAIAPWAATTTYTVGQIIRPTAAVLGKRFAYRCTTGGTTTGAEPAWGLTLGGTTTNGAVFTLINSDTYGWTAAMGDQSCATNLFGSGFAVVGDTIFLSSDHTETVTSTTLFHGISGSWGTATTYIISVNRAGSVPPVSGDITSGANISGTALTIDPQIPLYLNGVTLQASGSVGIAFAASSDMTVYLKNCSLQLTNVSSGSKIAVSTGEPSKIILDNTTVSFAYNSQGFNAGASGGVFELTWINTLSAVQGTMPTNLFSESGPFNAVLRGVDISGVTGTLLYGGGLNACKVLLDSCKIASGLTLLGGGQASPFDIVELVNCWDGTNARNERAQTAGTVVTERTITLTGGAADDVGAFSLKMVSGSAKIDKRVEPLSSFWFDVENTSTGSGKTATVEIVSSASLYNDEVWLQLEYMGTAGSQLSSIGDSQPVTPLTTHAAVTSSSASWNSSPATPVYQHLQVAFTPQRAGRVRGRVMLGKASTTVYVDPTIVIT